MTQIYQQWGKSYLWAIDEGRRMIPAGDVVISEIQPI